MHTLSRSLSFVSYDKSMCPSMQIRQIFSLSFETPMVEFSNVGKVILIWKQTC